MSTALKLFFGAGMVKFIQVSKITFLSFLGLLLVLSAPLVANEDMLTKKQLRLAILYTDEPPYIYLDNNSDYVGILPDLAQALSLEMDLELSFVPTPRKGLEKSVIDGRADMTWLSPNWVLDDAPLVFSKSVLPHREYLYSLSPFTDSNQPQEWLEGKTVCVRQDYSYPSLEPYFNQGVAQALRVSSQISLFKLLLKERCDLIYMNEYKATWLISDLGKETKVWRSHSPLNEESLSFAFNHHWKKNVALVDQALAKIQKTGQFDKIMAANIKLAN
jgi:polar amino acid transport system substrate-binding protein